MSRKRPLAAPPDIPGFQYISVLGSGGFSDVYLYEQDRPRRKVAVKVLVADLKTEGARRRFESEANLMAQLSTHPYIVTIYEAEVTAAGHSYLAMEYCSRPSLDIRSRRSKFSVDEALSVGIQVASAVETAHRAGIAHRDIKPANILVTDYNRPALTDFGISGTMDSVQDDDGGMSIPWSPPESFAAGATDGVKVDIWALAATIYTLLAGHSPFVIPGGDNSQRELMARIGSSPLPRLNRADVPEELNLVLATAMAKSPSSRYKSAMAFARALMRVQVDLNLSVTPFEVQEEQTFEEVNPDDEFEETRIRSVIAIDPDSHPSAPTFPSAFRTANPTDAPRPHINSVPGVAASNRAGISETTGSSAGLTQNGYTLPSAGPARGYSNIVSPTQWADSTAGTAPDAASGTATPQGGGGKLLENTVQRSELLASSQSGLATDLGDAEGGINASVLASSKKRLRLGLSAGVALLAAVVVAVVIILNGGITKPVDPAPSKTTEPAPAVIVGADVPGVTELLATASNGGAVWTWTNPEPLDGDLYLWASVSAVDSGEFKPTKVAKVFVANNPNNQSCVSVKLVRKNGSTSPETKKCFP